MKDKILTELYNKKDFEKKEANKNKTKTMAHIRPTVERSSRDALRLKWETDGRTKKSTD